MLTEAEKEWVVYMEEAAPALIDYLEGHFPGEHPPAVGSPLHEGQLPGPAARDGRDDTRGPSEVLPAEAVDGRP